MVADYYTKSAEFYEMVAARHAHTSAGPLTTALSSVCTEGGPVVEIGAGTGRITEVIARALPSVPIIAAEPSVPMRAMLTSRVFNDADLRKRVTIAAEPAQRLALPQRISAVVIFGVVGHLTQAERRDLWRELGARLPAGAPIVVELMGVGTARHVPPFRMLRETIGDQTYEWWTEAEPLKGQVMRWRTSWKVLRDGELVRSTTDSYDWENLTLEQLAEEAGMSSSLISAGGVPGAPEIGKLYR
ncbi:trans-aconitate 2-methyltransferase [Streptomyces sp. PTY087I2]|uniref:class I SAM-dependent methyltransferase n=1 Tax=Streptomyces sp. PTY087I2 TaxID=1819298 RepID=UPI000829312B|nr:class I SAM-dependent methyltransferase [Streptomyces sp. PTY087I2]OCC14036.1 Methyltransferase domain protein [Streptomyces sp. PTY087I2]